MNILFRCDASTQIGLGHLMRCLTLAHAFQSDGHNCVFLCKDYPEQLHKIAAPKFKVLLVPGNCNQKLDANVCIEECKNNEISLVVVDNYELDATWESHVSTSAPIICIDDLANRQHHCKVLIDSNFYGNTKNRYQSLVPEDCSLLLGPKYAIIRDEFYRVGKVAIPIAPHPLEVFCFFGGTDSSGETLRLLEHLESSKHDEGLHFQIVFTKANRYYGALTSFRNSPHYELQESPDSIAKLMSKCHIYLGSGGTVTWERMCLGLTGIVVSVADNQIQSASDLAASGFHIYAGKAQELHYSELIGDLKKLSFDRAKLNSMSVQCQKLVGKIETKAVLGCLRK